ncbi:hypothetical protein ABZ840_00945 [Streptomyces sp. NPDC047117]|uniref:hypothetical protein n=1 Tax=unclassified Streptomyces TaxID=2593676 RepID=UPI0033FE40E5
MGGTEQAKGPRGGAGFEIRIRGTVGEAFREAFGDLTVTRHHAETVLRGTRLDQAALYGILDRIQALGLELMEVRRLPPTEEPGAASGGG